MSIEQSPVTDTNQTLLQPHGRVLPTLEEDGQRRWLYPHLSAGFFWQARRALGYFLIVFFVTLPWLRISGKPLFLIDVLKREVILWGVTFLPTDSLVLAFFLVGLFVTMFLVTAIFGRAWCGWGCPQTVYMEFLYRPIERFFCGTSGRGGKPIAGLPPWKRVAMYAVYLVVSFLLANTFLSYFVGTDRLVMWVQQSPIHHPAPFMTMAIVTIAMMFDFCFFREQLCLIACPYGRFQSVLLDRKSLIVSYDYRRGEPRGHVKRSLPVIESTTTSAGDCIDCGACVRTCPTGIDIRDGLQLECVHCTQCIDACDEIMDKVEKPRGLIRYSCQDAIDGKSVSLIRPRIVIYPLILVAISVLLTFTLANRRPFDMTIMRNLGMPFSISEEGRVRNSLRIKLVNRTELPVVITIAVEEPQSGVTLDHLETTIKLDARMTTTAPVMVEAERAVFQQGLCPITLRLTNSSGESYTEQFQLIGPET